MADCLEFFDILLSVVFGNVGDCLVVAVSYLVLAIVACVALITPVGLFADDVIYELTGMISFDRYIKELGSDRYECVRLFGP